MMLLEKEPANRFPSASALVAALDTREAPTPRARREPPRRRVGTAQPTRGRLRRRLEQDIVVAHRATGRRTGRPRTARRRTRRTRRCRPARPGSAVARRRRRRRTSCAAGRIRTSSRFRKKIAPYLFVNGVIVLFSIFGQQRILPGHRALEHLHRVPVREAVERGLRLARRLPAAARPRADGGVRGGVRVRARDVQPGRARAAPRAARRAARAGARVAPRAPVRHGRVAAGELRRGAALSRTERRPRAPGDRRSRRDHPPPERAPEGASASASATSARSATALADKVGSRSRSRSRSCRATTSPARARCSSARSPTLENAANPLERGSEDRVRRLAYLKRQRRALVDAEKKRGSRGREAGDLRARAAEHALRPDAAEREPADAPAHHVAGRTRRSASPRTSTRRCSSPTRWAGWAARAARARVAPRSAGDRPPARPPGRRGRRPVPGGCGDRPRRDGRRLPRDGRAPQPARRDQAAPAGARVQSRTCASGSSARRRRRRS